MKLMGHSDALGSGWLVSDSLEDVLFILTLPAQLAVQPG